ncbi:hypothetical protein ACXJJ3_25895 [Kribbella sp. WER1]
MPKASFADHADTSTAAPDGELVELVERCEQFPTPAGPVVRTKLRTFRTGHPTQSGADSLIAALGLNAL